ncbi:hypothetical protein NC653_037422 [Populus alba x Populus x berolinensis]|uniref:Uncharacterized protein n=1 Tax=Populus alba x Populus x berolinensis TaxID=444605 RepID=A0AAD6LFD4_9ROSI|nr:hypothetical protein NC653_037190 [Populus alba x Populus x berolinensis]KAJ6959120.1 hypothetical protein NC653_037422 [Populus alba x Populus x berolinensis]
MEKKGERGKQHRRTPDECRQRRTEKRASPADQGNPCRLGYTQRPLMHALHSDRVIILPLNLQSGEMKEERTWSCCLKTKITGGGATGDEAGARALAGQCFYMFLSHLLLQTSPGYIYVLPWVPPPFFSLAREYHAVVTTGLVTACRRGSSGETCPIIETI